jgi:LacI family transcriptional regulator
MRRVTIGQIMRATGLSRATVDRALHGRGHVHPRTRAAVEDSLRRLSMADGPPAADRPEPRPLRADIVLRVGRGLMAQLRAAWTAQGAEGAFHDLHGAEEPAVLRSIAALCRDPARPLIVTVKNSERMVSLLAAARARGKRIVTLVSDLAPAARDGFAGLDDRAAGQTAAFLIGRTFGDRPTTVGVVLGSPAFRCHEDREIGFRTGLRARFPKVVLAAEVQGEDSAERTRRAVAALLQAQPALAALYSVGGGNAGLAEALRAAGRAADVLVVGHEANHVTLPLLRAGAMDFAIAGDPRALLAAALRLAAEPDSAPRGGLAFQDFGIYTRHNLPAFALP